MVIFFVSHLVLFEEKLAWVSFVADCFSHNFIRYRHAWEKGKKGKNVGSVPVTYVHFMASVWPVPSANRLQGLFGPRVSFYWGVLRSRRVMQPVQSQAFITEVAETSWVLWWQAQGPAQDFLVMKHLGSWHFSLLRPVRGPSALWGPQGPPSHPVMQLCLFSLF